MKIPALVGAVLLGALLILVGAMGARWLGPLAPAATPAAGGAPAAGPSSNTAAALDLDAVRELLRVIEPARRREILASDEAFARFIEQERVSRSVLAAAYANGAHSNPSMRMLMERAGQRVLAETYLTQVVRTNLDPDFPTSEQVREAYDKNPDLFRVPERMHLWQIFVPLPADADDATTKAAWQLAERLSGELRAGKIDFATAAKEHSAHEPSRVNDGYMGLLKVADLLPPIAEAAADLEIGAVSEPVASEAGLHLIKRGPTVAGELLAFDKVAANLRERLLREGAAKLREAALEKIAEQYPVPTLDAEVGADWRTRLAADEAKAAPDTTAAERTPSAASED